LKGGNIIWIGDIPFAYRGYYNHKLQQLGINDQIVMLGLVSAFGFSQNKIVLTKSGKNYKITHTYHGIRPVHLYFLIKWKDSM